MNDIRKRSIHFRSFRCSTESVQYLSILLHKLELCEIKSKYQKWFKSYLKQ